MCAAWGAGVRCPPSARAQPVFGALSSRGEGLCRAGCWQHWMHTGGWEMQEDSFLSAMWLVCWDSKAKARLLAAPLASGCAPVSLLSHGSALLVVVLAWRCIPGAAGPLSLGKSSLLPRRLGGRRQDLALQLSSAGESQSSRALRCLQRTSLQSDCPRQVLSKLFSF